MRKKQRSAAKPAEAKPVRTCLVCGKQFRGRGVLCSVECRHEYYRIEAEAGTASERYTSPEAERIQRINEHYRAFRKREMATWTDAHRFCAIDPGSIR